jgi:DNA invertase Pin-like site-specific DNA recombinase
MAYLQSEAWKMVATRGPRYAVIGSIRKDEARVTYAMTGEEAEQIAANYREQWGYYQIAVHAPEGSIDLTKFGKELAAARTVVREKTEILRAAVNRAAEEGRAEAEIARQAGVDRMTVRSWLGKDTPKTDTEEQQ